MTRPPGPRPIPKLVLAGLSLALGALVPRLAPACGASGGGAAGISGCSLSEHEEEARPKWRVGGAYSFTSTELHFTSGLRVDEIRNSAGVAVDYALTSRLTLEGSVGPFLGGRIVTPLAHVAMTPGLAAGIGGSYRAVDADGARPFVLLTAQLSYVSSSAPTDTGYNAFDLRLGGAVGWSFWHALAPYIMGRGFGGPVYWRYQGAAVVGTDDHHWQVGGGLSLRLGKRFDVFAEGVPLGEQGASAGLGSSF